MKLLLISIPKTGTNMFTQAVGGSHKQLGVVIANLKHPIQKIENQMKKYSRFARGHLPYHERYVEIIKEHNIYPVFLIRDPRDMIVSHKFWIHRADDVGFGFMNFEVEPGVRLNQCDDPISELIKRYDHHMRRHIGWMNEPNVHVIRYEDMVRKTEQTFAKCIGWMPPQLRAITNCTKAQAMVKRVRPETCSTFRKGIVGDWKNHFSKKHVDLFWDEMGDLMELLEYD